MYMYTYMCMYRHIGMHLYCSCLKASLTFLASSSGSMLMRESFIHVSCHFIQSDAVTQRFLYGSNSRDNLPTLSYCRQVGG